MKAFVALLALYVLALPKFTAESPMTVAAKAFVASLDENQRAMALFSLDSTEKANLSSRLQLARKPRGI